MRPNEFAGRVAVVTGAASGIGRAAARMVASHGASVICLDLDSVGLAETAELLRSDGNTTPVHTGTVDAAEAAEVADAIGATGIERVDMVFNIAGMLFHKPLLESGTADLLRVMRANVGTLLTTTAVTAPMMTRGGVIVNVSSSASHLVIPGSGLYGASKDTVVFLTRALANELSSRGIRVCAVCPGIVDTPMPRRVAADLGITEVDAFLDRAAQASQLILDLARPEDVADAIGYLASHEGRLYTGTTVHMDGGAGALSSRFDLHATS
jgi:2-keto-3-deoxy-L-fuconate dehydrogenase